MLAFLHSALQGVVTGGTARVAFTGFPLASYPVAGKTGTAEVFGKQPTSWFASYAAVRRPSDSHVQRFTGSAAQTLVGLLRAFLGRGPPGLVIAVPLDRLGEPGTDVLVFRGPSRLGPQLA
jgi:hypothetical protein